MANATKAIAHARGLAFVPVPRTLLQMLTNCPSREDDAVAEYVQENKKGWTPEFVQYAVEINRILRDDVLDGHMCDVVTKETKKGGKTWEPPMGEGYLLGNLGLNKDGGYFAGTSLMIALQMTDIESKPTMHCVAVLAYGAVNNFDKNDFETLYENKGGDTGNRLSKTKKLVSSVSNELPAQNLQKDMDNNNMLDICLLCARGATDAATRSHRQTVRLMTIYTIAKEMMRKKGGHPMYHSVFMDCAGYYPAKSKKLQFDAENIAIEMGFHRWKVTFPAFPAAGTKHTGKNKDFNNANDQYDFKKGSSRVYILSDAETPIYMKFLYYLENYIANSDMIKKVCAMKPRTKVPGCV